MRRRLAVLMTAVLAMALLAAVPAGAATPRATTTLACWQTSKLCPWSSTPGRIPNDQALNTAPQFGYWYHNKYVGPSARTGYGRATFPYYTLTRHATGGHYGLGYYTATRAYRYMAPVSPMGPSRAVASDFCFGLNFGTSCWNQPWTWNWGGWFGDIAGELGRNLWHNLQLCSQGIVGGGFVTTYGGSVAGGLFEWDDILTVTPQGFLRMIVGGCVIAIGKDGPHVP